MDAKGQEEKLRCYQSKGNRPPELGFAGEERHSGITSCEAERNMERSVNFVWFDEQQIDVGERELDYNLFAAVLLKIPWTI